MNTPSLQDLLEAGVHFGHKVARGNPRMKPFIYGARDGIHIIDLTKSEEYLKKACEFVNSLGKEGKVMLFVGTKKQASPIVKEAAVKVGAPYMVNRWVGGFFTNFDEICKNINLLKDLKEQKAKRQLQKYTKKEQLLIDRRIAKLEKDFSGVTDLVRIPDAIFITDAVGDLTALKEANKKGVTVVAIADSNSDPSLIDYPIPGNDDAIKAIKIMADTVANFYGDGLKKASQKALEDEERIKKEEAEAKVEIPEEEVLAIEEKVEEAAIEESGRKS